MNNIVEILRMLKKCVKTFKTWWNYLLYHGVLSETEAPDFLSFTYLTVTNKQQCKMFCNAAIFFFFYNVNQFHLYVQFRW